VQLNKARVLVVEDDPTLQSLLTFDLQEQFFDTTVVVSAEKAMRLLELHEYDLIIVDHKLPKMSGVELLNHVRSKLHLRTPVIVVSGKKDAKESEGNGELGPTDFLAKPFDLADLNTRIKVHLRRVERIRLAENGVLFKRRTINFGDVSVDRDARTVIKGGKEAYLRQKEFDLLVFLLERPGVVATRREIMDTVWGTDSPSGSKAVDVTMRTLRQKIEADPAKPKHLLTSRGVGYRFEF
jgi:DNA-binding response OmpR family regulator